MPSHCKKCNRPKGEPHHKKIFYNWVCDLVFLSDNRWVHSSRVPHIVGKRGKDGETIQVVTKLLDK